MSIIGLLLMLSSGVHAGLFSSSQWIMRTQSGTVISQVQDNNPDTGVLLASTTSVVRVVIDMGTVATIHRVYFTATGSELDPLSTAAALSGSRMFTVSVYAAEQPNPGGAAILTYEGRSVTGKEIRIEANLRFPPTACRYLALDLNRGALSNRWNLGEVEVYGWSVDGRTIHNDAVIIATNAADPLTLAAQELSYYLGELSGQPVPMIPSTQSTLYTGSLYRVVDLKYLAPTYEQMTNNQALGMFPATPVNVERNGREIIFRAWPYRNVLWSVWEFLDRQGVKWLYPDAHGDFVPTGQGINVDVAPLQYKPSTDFIYANFGVEYLRDDPDAFLHFWRNRWTHTWGGHQRDTFGGTEVPPRPIPPYIQPADYVEGFDGYPHNFKNVIPDRILAQHPSWCGILTNSEWASWVGADKLNRRLPPSQNNTTFDMTNPEARQFVIDKAISVWPYQYDWNGDIYWLLPEDSALFSEDEESIRLRQPLQDDPIPFAFPYSHSVSGDYYDFICHIADGIRDALPEARVGAMAYSNTHRPPERTTPFPSNVLVDICMYGVRNLPMSSPKNAALRERLETWAGLASQIRHYDYDLIHCEKSAQLMPVPLVRSFEDRAHFYKQHHMFDGGTQADLETLPYNPWNYYAYPRFYWNLSLSADTVLQEFFGGYYREASVPMLNYYNTIEHYIIANNVSLQARGYDYGMHVGAFPISVLKKMHQYLLTAESQATYWVTRQRVQKAREGFNWILQQRGLTVDDLIDTSGFMRVGPGHDVTIDLRNALIQTAGQDVGDAWYFFSWAQVGDYVNVEKSGRYRVTFYAGVGDPVPLPCNREMMFRIGALEYGPFLIDHQNMETYTLLVDIPAGIVEVSVEDLNNDGPFKVSTITIQAVDTEPAPTKLTQLSLTHFYDFAAEGNPAANIDSDWDGTSDLAELLAGTDELDPDSFFAVRNFIPAPDGLHITWPSVAGKHYALYRATSLGDEFTLVATDLPATPPENMYADHSAPDTAFYQIGVY